MLIELPFPPSVNSYWKINFKTKKVYISKKGQDFRKEVKKRLQDLKDNNSQELTQYLPEDIKHNKDILKKYTKPFITGKIRINTILHEPDKRKRDIDNPKKCLYDSLVHAGIIEDDSQIRQEWSELRSYNSNVEGKVILEIEQLITGE